MTGGEGRSGGAAEPKDGLVAVVAAVVRRGDRYLLGRRPQAKRHGGMWEFPGGKLHPGEAPSEGLRRELKEELGLACAGHGRPLWSARDPGSPFVIDFLAVDAEGAPAALEHQEVGWFTLEELREMPLAPTDAAFVAVLAGSGRA